MRACHKCLKLLDSIVDIFSKVGTYIIVVFDCVRRTRIAFHYIMVVRANAMLGVVGLGCVFDNTCVPHAINAKLLYGFKHLGINLIHLADTVLINRAVMHTSIARVGENSRKHLIYYKFLFIIH